MLGVSFVSAWMIRGEIVYISILCTMKKVFLFIVLIAPHLFFAQTILRDDGPSALEVAQRRAAYEREIARARADRLAEENRVQENASYGRRNEAESVKKSLVIYDLVSMPMDDKWGSLENELPNGLILGGVSKQDDKTLVYRYEFLDFFFGNVKATEFDLYYENGRLIEVQTIVLNTDVMERAKALLGAYQQELTDGSGKKWYVWYSGRTGLCIASKTGGWFVTFFSV